MTEDDPYKIGLTGDRERIIDLVGDIMEDDGALHALARGAFDALKTGREQGFLTLLSNSDSCPAALDMMRGKPRADYDMVIAAITDKADPRDLRNMSAVFEYNSTFPADGTEKLLKTVADDRLESIRKSGPMSTAPALKDTFENLKEPGYGKWRQRERNARREARIKIMQNPPNSGP